MSTVNFISGQGFDLHVGVITPPTTPPPPSATTTNGGFLDFLVAIAALIMIANAHKFARQFLDHLIPGGGGGRGMGSLMSGILEGAGMEIGWSGMKQGGRMMKAAGGVATAGGIGGLAAAMKYSKESGGMLGKDDVGSMLRKTTSADGGPLGLYPPGLPGGKDTPKRLPGPRQSTSGDSNGGTSESGGSGGATASGFGMSFGPRMESGADSRASSGVGSLFDGASTRNGAATQMKPSAQGKLQEVSPKGTTGGVAKAFLGGAANRMKKDIMHKATGGKGYAPAGEGDRSAHNLLGVMGQELGGYRKHEAKNQLDREAFVPGKHLMDSADRGDGFALADVGRIGQHQAEMEEGMQWLEQGNTLKQAIQPDYDAAKSNLYQAEHETNALDVIRDKYKAQGMTNSPEYQEITSRYTAAKTRQEVAESTFKAKENQMTSAENTIIRGDQRVQSSQDAISTINWSWMPERQQNASWMVQAAQARANRPSLSGLGQALNHHSKRR